MGSTDQALCKAKLMAAVSQLALYFKITRFCLPIHSFIHDHSHINKEFNQSLFLKLRENLGENLMEVKLIRGSEAKPALSQMNEYLISSPLI